MRRRLLHVLARVHGKHRLIDYNNDMTTTMRKLLREERNFETNDRDTYQESLCQQLFMFPPRLPGYPEEFHVVVSEMPPMVGINGRNNPIRDHIHTYVSCAALCEIKPDRLLPLPDSSMVSRR